MSEQITRDQWRAYFADYWNDAEWNALASEILELRERLEAAERRWHELGIEIAKRRFPSDSTQ